MDRGMNCWQLSQPCSQHSTRWKGPRKETCGLFRIGAEAARFQKKLNELVRVRACRLHDRYHCYHLFHVLSFFMMLYHSALWKHKRKVQGVRRCGVLRCQFTVHFPQLASWWTGVVEVATQRLSSCWSHCRGRTARHHTTPLSAKMLSSAIMKLKKCFCHLPIWSHLISLALLIIHET